MSKVRDYYADVELHANITINIAEQFPELMSQTIDDEIAYRAPLLGEKFLHDVDNVETDLRRCIFKLLTRHY